VALLAWSAFAAAQVVRRTGRASPALFLIIVFMADCWRSPLERSSSGQRVTFSCSHKHFVLVDGLGKLMSRGRSRVLAAGFAAWAIAGGLSAYPRCLNYLNEFAGGTSSVAAQASYASASDCGIDVSLLAVGSTPTDLPGPLESPATRWWTCGRSGSKPRDPRLIPDLNCPTSQATRVPLARKPGVYAIDAFNLSKPRWGYFLAFEPSPGRPVDFRLSDRP